MVPSPTGRDDQRLRVIPNLDAIRPADPEETAGAAALQRTDGPTGLILTRQNLSNLSMIPVRTGGTELSKAPRGSAGTRCGVDHPGFGE